MLAHDFLGMLHQRKPICALVSSALIPQSIYRCHSLQSSKLLSIVDLPARVLTFGRLGRVVVEDGTGKPLTRSLRWRRHIFRRSGADGRPLMSVEGFSRTHLVICAINFAMQGTPQNVGQSISGPIVSLSGCPHLQYIKVRSKELIVQQRSTVAATISINMKRDSFTL